MLHVLQHDRMVVWGAVDEPRVQAIFRHDTNEGDCVTNNAKRDGVKVAPSWVKAAFSTIFST